MTHAAGLTELRLLAFGEQGPDTGLDVVFVHEFRHVSRSDPALAVNQERIRQFLDSVFLCCWIAPPNMG